MAAVASNAQADRHQLMKNELRSLLPDHASETDHRKLPIDRVGIKNLRYPINVLDRSNSLRPTVAQFSVYVHVPADERGTHMSRLVEVVHQHQGDMTVRKLPNLLSTLSHRLNNSEVQVTLRFPYFIEKKAPVSSVPSFMDYTVTFDAKLCGGQFDFVLTVKVPVKSLCPCSKGISDRGAHNQRSFVTVSVKSQTFVWIEDIVDCVESAASSPLYALLKREDEKFVTEYAYDNAKFAEDLARDTVIGLRELDDFSMIAVLVENHESIHNHEAVAELVWRKDSKDRTNHESNVPASSSSDSKSTALSFGEWLRLMRTQRHLSQAELAKRVGLTPSNVSRIETGTRSPSTEVLRILGAQLGIDDDEVYLRAGYLPPRFVPTAIEHPNKIMERLNSLLP